MITAGIVPIDNLGGTWAGSARYCNLEDCIFQRGRLFEILNVKV